MEPVDDSNREAGQVVQPDGTCANKAGILLEREEVQRVCVGYERTDASRLGGVEVNREGQPSCFLHGAWTKAEGALEFGKSDDFGQTINISLVSLTVKWG